MESPELGNQQDHHNISWEADDFYYNPKNFSWYFLAILASFIFAAIPLVLSRGKEYFAPGIILVSLIGLVIYAGRRPEKKHFSLQNNNLTINSQKFDLHSFSRYWVEVFDTHTQVTLVGIKRTAMPISLCLTDKEVTKKVLNILQANIPETSPSKNPTDWLMRKIKF